MDMTPWHLILAFVAGWFCTMTGGFLVGWLVFRTKREHHERLFQFKKQEEEGAVNLDDGLDFIPEQPKEEVANDELPRPKIVEDMNKRVQEQLRNG